MMLFLPLTHLDHSTIEFAAVHSTVVPQRYGSVCGPRLEEVGQDITVELAQWHWAVAASRPFIRAEPSLLAGLRRS